MNKDKLIGCLAGGKIIPYNLIGSLQDMTEVSEYGRYEIILEEIFSEARERAGCPPKPFYTKKQKKVMAEIDYFSQLINKTFKHCYHRDDNITLLTPLWIIMASKKILPFYIVQNQINELEHDENKSLSLSFFSSLIYLIVIKAKKKTYYDEIRSYFHQYVNHNIGMKLWYELTNEKDTTLPVVEAFNIFMKYDTNYKLAISKTKNPITKILVGQLIGTKIGYKKLGIKNEEAEIIVDEIINFVSKSLDNH